MMPEHIEMLNDYWKKERYIEKPHLSVDHYDQMNQTIQEAMKHTLDVSIQYYDNHRIKVIEGIINRPNMGRLEIQTEEKIHYLGLAEIVDVLII